MSVAAQVNENNRSLKDRGWDIVLAFLIWLGVWVVGVNLVFVGIPTSLFGLAVFSPSQAREFALWTVLFSVLASTPSLILTLRSDVKAIWSETQAVTLFGGYVGGAAGVILGLTSNSWGILSQPTPLGLAQWVACAGITGAVVTWLWAISNTEEADDWADLVWNSFLEDYLVIWVMELHGAVLVLTFVVGSVVYFPGFGKAAHLAFLVATASLVLSTLSLLLTIKQDITTKHGSISFMGGYLVGGLIGGILALIGTLLSPILLGITLPPVEMASLFIALSMSISIVGGIFFLVRI